MLEFLMCKYVKYLQLTMILMAVLTSLMILIPIFTLIYLFHVKVSFRKNVRAEMLYR